MVLRDSTPIDSHNMFVATIASAHMPTWLHIAFGMDVEVERYIDRAYGVLAAVEGGDCWISELDRRYPLCETPAAIRYLEQGHARGKVVLDVD